MNAEMADSEQKNDYQKRLESKMKANQTTLEKTHNYIQDGKQHKKSSENVLPSERYPGNIDSQYLAGVLGSALQNGLAELCEKRPFDPIEYLSRWLRKYASNTERNIKKQELDKELMQVKSEAAAKKERKRLLAHEMILIEEEEARCLEIYNQRVENIEKEPRHNKGDDKSTENCPKPTTRKTSENGTISRDEHDMQTIGEHGMANKKPMRSSKPDQGNISQTLSVIPENLSEGS